MRSTEEQVSDVAPQRRVRVRLYCRGGDGYERTAELRVYEGGARVLDDPEQLFAFDVPVMTEAGPVRWNDDPMAWARSLGSMYRSGYIVARIDEADETVPSVAGERRGVGAVRRG